MKLVWCYILKHTWTQRNLRIPVIWTVSSSCKQLTRLSFMLPSCGLKGPSVERQKVWLPVGQMGKFSGLFKPSKWGEPGWIIGLTFNSHTADFLRRGGSTIRSFTLKRVHFLKLSHYMKWSWWGHTWQESLRRLTQQKNKRPVAVLPAASAHLFYFFYFFISVVWFLFNLSHLKATLKQNAPPQKI